MSGTKKSSSDIAASKMGDLLLKGYRMLDASCPDCGTVLMQGRNGENVCVACVGRDDDVEAMNQKNIQNSGGIDMEGNEEVVLDLSSAGGIDQVIKDIVSDMLTMSGQLRQQPKFEGKQRVLEYIRLCAQVIKDLKEISN